MQKFEIILTDKHAREYNYFLGNRYGKKKRLLGKLKIAIMEMVAIQARKEADESHLVEKLVSKKFTEEEAIKIFRWLLGYTDFPPRKDGEGAYWWRSNLRVLLNRVGITKKVLEDSKFSG